VPEDGYAEAYEQDSPLSDDQYVPTVNPFAPADIPTMNHIYATQQPIFNPAANPGQLPLPEQLEPQAGNTEYTPPPAMAAPLEPQAGNTEYTPPPAVAAPLEPATDSYTYTENGDTSTMNHIYATQQHIATAQARIAGDPQEPYYD